MARHSIMVAEFQTPAEIVEAAGKMNDAGYRRYDAHTPFPVHGLDKAMAIPVSRLGWIVFPCGLTGTATALGIEWYSAAGVYPLIIGGKPFFSFPAFVPVMFALTILFSAFAAVFGMLAINGLPRLSHPLLAHPRFRGFSDDRFFISVDSLDPKFDVNRTAELLQRLGGKHVTVVEE